MDIPSKLILKADQEFVFHLTFEEHERFRSHALKTRGAVLNKWATAFAPSYEIRRDAARATVKKRCCEFVAMGLFTDFDKPESDRRESCELMKLAFDKFGNPNDDRFTTN